MANVRFYKLNVLPSFDVSKHVGIFVHLTANTTIEDKIYKAGLWFGGATDWEYLTNDTNAIDAAIDAKIQGLDVLGYAQATITTNTPTEGESNSTLTISGIKEDNGQIAKDDGQKLEVAIDGGYHKENNKIATQTTVTKAIDGLNADTIQVVTKTTSNNNTTLTFNGVKEEKGVIARVNGTDSFTVGNANLKIQIGSDTATNVFSSNAIEDSTIKLDGLVFKKNGDVISVITPTALALDNRLVTEKDVASLAGAMHYKGTVSSLQEFTNIINNTDSDSDAEEAGNVYIATGIPEGSFTDDNGNVIENGDMIVFNSASEYKVIQSNITLGINSGQIAKNDGNLTPNNMVIATSNGIKTIDITETQLTGADNNSRTLSIDNGTINDNGFHHAVTITDTFKVIGKDFNQSIDIKSSNRSIDIAADGNTGVIVDLVWNTSIE